jgi:lysophospholipase L1-like esterase
MKKVVLLGDSLTYGYGLESGVNWSDTLTHSLADTSVVNCGIPGDTTSGMLSRFQQQVLVVKPDAVVIFGGLNDLNWNTDISVVASNLNAMIAQAQFAGIKPVLVITSAIDPVGSLAMFGHNQQAVETLRNSVKKLSEQHAPKIKLMYGHGPTALKIIDAYALFEQYAAQNGYSPLYQPDGIHLSQLGASLIADKVISEFPII